MACEQLKHVDEICVTGQENTRVNTSEASSDGISIVLPAGEEGEREMKRRSRWCKEYEQVDEFSALNTAKQSNSSAYDECKCECV